MILLGGFILQKWFAIGEFIAELLNSLFLIILLSIILLIILVKVYYVTLLKNVIASKVKQSL